MYKLLLALFITLNLNAQFVDGVSIVVKGEAITLYEIKKEMKLSNTDAKNASNILIRRVLENAEIRERGIHVSSSDVYDDIRKTAARNNMDISTFYEAIRNSNGINSTDLKDKIKQKLLSQKLYSAIAYSEMSQPTQSEIEEYYELHKEEFSHPSSFEVTIYSSKDQARLQEKINNPMFYAPDILTNEQVLPYERISPQLASLLKDTALNSFTQIVPDAKGGFMSFYLKSIVSAKEGGIKSVENTITNAIMSNKREHVLSDYFARLKQNADIKTIREVE